MTETFSLEHYCPSYKCKEICAHVSGKGRTLPGQSCMARWERNGSKILQAASPELGIKNSDLVASYASTTQNGLGNQCPVNI